MKTVKSGITERRGAAKRRKPAGDEGEPNGGRAEAGSATIVSEPHPPEQISPEREERIRMRAYLRAKERGFAGGDEVVDWLEAEREVAEEERNEVRERKGGMTR